MAQRTALGFGIWLLSNAHSATSGTCFTLAAGLILLTGLRRIRGRPSAVHKLVMTFLLFGVLLKLTGADTVVVEQGIGRMRTSPAELTSGLWSSLWRQTL